MRRRARAAGSYMSHMKSMMMIQVYMRFMYRNLLTRGLPGRRLGARAHQISKLDEATGCWYLKRSMFLFQEFP